LIELTFVKQCFARKMLVILVIVRNLYNPWWITGRLTFLQNFVNFYWFKASVLNVQTGAWNLYATIWPSDPRCSTEIQQISKPKAVTAVTENNTSNIYYNTG